MSKIIEKTVVSKYAPHDTNVDWLDVSGDKPVKKSYINGKWQVISGGGSGAGSSNPTEADATKVWQVTPVQKGIKSETFEILPETTLIDGALEIDNATNLDKFVDGNKVTAVIDGVTYNSYIQGFTEEGITVYEAAFQTPDNTYYFYYENNEYFGWSVEETQTSSFTASLSVIEEVPDYDYNWAPGVKIPIPTSKDEGKTLVVTKVEDKENSNEYELAPKQTVTITEGDVILQNTSNLDKFVEGATVTSVINGITYTGQVMNDDGILYVEIGDDDAGWFLDLIENGTELMFTGSPETYEISVSVLVKEYSYEYQLTNDIKGCNLTNLECFNNSAIYTARSLQDILNDGYTYVYFGDSNKGGLYIVKIEGDNPSYNNGQFIDCSPVVIPSFLVDMYKSPWRDTTSVLFHACNIYNNNDISYEFEQNVFGFDFNYNGNGYDLDKVKGLGIVFKSEKFILGAHWSSFIPG